MRDQVYFPKLRAFLTDRRLQRRQRVAARDSRHRADSIFSIESLEPRVLLAADLAAAAQAVQIVDPTVTHQAAVSTALETDQGSPTNTSQATGSNPTNEMTTSVGTVPGQFGTAPGRSQDLVLEDADGTRVRFNLEGGGVGEVRVDADGRWDVHLTGTVAQSIFTIETQRQGDGRVQIDDIHVVGPLGAIDAQTTHLVGTLAIDDPVGGIRLGSASNALIAAPTIQIGIDIVGNFNQSTILVGAQLGQDGQLGGTGVDADIFGPGTLGGLRIGGQVISDVQSPTLTAALANDTGNPDGVTRDPTISGTASDQSGIATLHAGFDGVPSVDMSSKLQGGAFTLTRGDLEAINGGTLPDDNYTLTLLARDANGIGQVTKVTFTLDTTDPGLISWYPGDGTAEDVVGPHDGTLVNGAGFAPGKEGQAFSFDGIDDEVVINSTFPFHNPGDATLGFWLRVNSTRHQSVFWTRPDDADTNRFNIFVNGDNTFGFDYRSPSGALHSLVGGAAGGVQIERDTWTHLAVTRVGNVYSLYRNGVLETSATDVSPDLPTSTGWQFSGRSGFTYQGLLDEVRVYDRALSVSEIQHLQ